MTFFCMTFQEHFRSGEERSRWEKELAEAEVDALMLQEEIRSRKARLLELKKYSSDTIALRLRLNALDRTLRERTASMSETFLHLPDSHYNGHLQEVISVMAPVALCELTSRVLDMVR